MLSEGDHSTSWAGLSSWGYQVSTSKIPSLLTNAVPPLHSAPSLLGVMKEMSFNTMHIYFVLHKKKMLFKTSTFSTLFAAGSFDCRIRLLFGVCFVEPPARTHSWKVGNGHKSATNRPRMGSSWDFSVQVQGERMNSCSF